MREARAALNDLAARRKVNLDDRAAARYLVAFSGHRTHDILRAIRAAADADPRFPSVNEILSRLPSTPGRRDDDDPPPATPEQRAAVRHQATQFLARFGMQPSELRP